jgi:N-methylhydantoinase A
MTRLGIDTGGTFTDFVLWRGDEVHVHKVLSTPAAPEVAILQGIADLGLDPARLRIVHGSTVATNAVLERRGVRTLYVANRGLKDLLAIGRQARARLYDLQPPKPPPPVPAELCWETGGRLGADGTWVEALTAADIAEFTAALRRLSPQAVAINLLFSYLDDSAERTLEAAVPDGIFCSRSSEILPVAGEYERGIATWLNAWVGPLVGRYLGRLQSQVPGAALSVMQSSGEAVAAGQTARRAVHLLLSGPAGGLVGAGFVGRLAGYERVLTFDMGGTSTDVALLAGTPRLTMEGRVAGYPVAVPMVDLHTIGAGGGSIARLDAGGILLVGPESAGADPGPACYGRGGTEPTVTDANLVLGRLRPDAFLGGRMSLDAAAARAALVRLAQGMGTTLEQAAAGIVDLANEHMARALRVISVQRGIDPRGFVLVSFGGAGGLHVCALAEALGMDQALVPVHAGVLSALGMLAARPGRTLTRTWGRDLAELTDDQVAERLAGLAQEGALALAAEGLDPMSLAAELSLDLRYVGQSYTLNVPWRGVTASADGFHRAHLDRYGHRLAMPVELVNLRARVSGPAPELRLPHLAVPEPQARWPGVRLVGWEAEVPVLPRSGVPLSALPGPAIIVDPVATTWLAPEWTAKADSYGNLLLWRRGPGTPAPACPDPPLGSGRD